MKAVVLEVNGNSAAVLKEDGTIEKINRICQVGEEIVLKEQAKILKMPRKYLAAAASFALAVILGCGGLVYAAPSSYVTMDAKLSFEFALNAFDKVVSMKSLTEEGEVIATEYNNQSSYHPTIDEAVALTSELLYDANYLSGDETDSVIISAVSTSDEKSLALSEKAKSAVSEVGSKYGSTTDIATAIGTNETRSQAAADGVSTGQYIKSNSSAAKGVYNTDKNSSMGNSTSDNKNDSDVAVIDNNNSDAKSQTSDVTQDSDASALTVEHTGEANSDSSRIKGGNDKNAPYITDNEKNAAFEPDTTDDIITNIESIEIEDTSDEF